MTGTITLILDVVIAGLLIATIFYAFRLNRHIEQLRDSRSDLADLIAGLNEATANAEAAVRGLRKAAGDTGEQLQRTIDKAATLRDELQIMTESGESLANRLDGVARIGGLAMAGADRTRSGAGDGTPTVRPVIAPQRPAAGPRVPPIDESLMAAARAEAGRTDPRTAAPAAAAKPKSEGGSGEGGGDGEGLSRAERELLQALESRR